MNTIRVRAEAPGDDPAQAEAAFASAPVRRMIAESLFDSVIQAGHLFDVKYPAGANVRTIRELVRIPVEKVGDSTGTFAEV